MYDTPCAYATSASACHHKGACVHHCVRSTVHAHKAGACLSLREACTNPTSMHIARLVPTRLARLDEVIAHSSLAYYMAFAALLGGWLVPSTRALLRYPAGPQKRVTNGKHEQLSLIGTYRHMADGNAVTNGRNTSDTPPQESGQKLLQHL
ncbi:hypothetical protein BGX38DRAFT_102094 [Terfezia claveryi]|nr:hypothetical protein BGX38DRAFT_102094 [Terfezia claveryi]